MSLEDALKELQANAINLEKVGDVKEFIQNNKDEFMHRYIKVMQYYKYLEKNTKMEGTIFFEALSTLEDICKSNPSLAPFMNQLTKMELYKIEETPSLKVANLTNKIEKLVSDIETAGYRPENFDDIEWALENTKKELFELKEDFSLSEYERLLNMLDKKLDNIHILTKQEQSLNAAYNL